MLLLLLLVVLAKPFGVAMLPLPLSVTRALFTRVLPVFGPLLPLAPVTVPVPLEVLLLRLGLLLPQLLTLLPDLRLHQRLPQGRRPLLKPVHGRLDRRPLPRPGTVLREGQELLLFPLLLTLPPVLLIAAPTGFRPLLGRPLQGSDDNLGTVAERLLRQL